jgi:hypothetical protein
MKHSMFLLASFLCSLSFMAIGAKAQCGAEPYIACSETRKCQDGTWVIATPEQAGTPCSKSNGGPITGTCVVGGSEQNPTASCSGPLPQTFAVYVTVSNLTGGTLILQDNGGSQLSIAQNGRYSFSGRVANGAPYNVTVSNPQPAGQVCTPGNASGLIHGADISNVTVSCVPGNSELTGFVDLHTHPLANLGFGGDLIFGGVDSSGSLLASTPASCSQPVRSQSVTDALSDEQPSHGGCQSIPGSGFDNTCCNDIREAAVHFTQSGNNAYDPPDVTYATAGYPSFPTWPVWNDITRQKMWVDWIRRAHDGGLAVMVALAVNSPMLATLMQGDLPGDDKASADLQIQEIQAFVGRHSDFMAVASDSTELYNIVYAHKLAVVIGVEVDNIGDFSLGQNPPATAEQAIAEVDRLFAEGVRYIFPIHVVDNVFGGTALYDDMFAIANIFEEDEIEAPTCSVPTDNINYVFGAQLSSPLEQFVINQVLTSNNSLTHPQPCNTPLTGHVNPRGLTPVGRAAILEMMSKHMLIDIDHMSQKSAEDALMIAESQKQGTFPGYPMMSGHNALRHALPNGQINNERSSSLTQYQRIGRLHGMAGVGSVNVDACAWLNSYGEVVTAMGTNTGGSEIIAGFGTDTDGLQAGMPPRLSVFAEPPVYTTCVNDCEAPLKFGPCSTDSGGPQGTECKNAKAKCATSCSAKYPPQMIVPTCNGKSAPSNVTYTALPVSSLGTQSWNYNQIGVAHYGMLPDFLQDLNSLPVGETIPAGFRIDRTPCPQGMQCAAQTLPNGSIVYSQLMKGARYFYDTWKQAESLPGTQSH